MVMDYIDIGSSPVDEDCAQVGTENYAPRAREECRKFIELIRTCFGPEPSGAQLTIKANPHDFGAYYEVVCKYDPDNENAVKYAFAVEGDTPTSWKDVDPRDWRST